VRYLNGEPVHYPGRAGFMESLRAGELTFRRVERCKQRRVRIEKRARVGSDTRPWRGEEILSAF
jgi:hypothetical protein